MNLRQRNARFYYKAEELCYETVEVCDERVWDSISSGATYSKRAKVMVRSCSSLLIVGIEMDSKPGIMGRKQRSIISNCPYELGALIGDSKLNCTFGYRDHQYRI
jgi:hypothetical protein